MAVIWNGWSRGFWGSRRTHYIITEWTLLIRRKHFFLRFDEEELELALITRTKMHQSAFDSMLGVGTVYFLYEGKPGFSMERVANPSMVRRKLSEAADRCRQYQRLESTIAMSNIIGGMGMRGAQGGLPQGGADEIHVSPPGMPQAGRRRSPLADGDGARYTARFYESDE